MGLAFTKIQMVFQIAPMVPLFELLLLRQKKQSEWLQREFRMLKMPQLFASHEKLNLERQNKAIFIKKSQMSNYICAIIKRTNGKDFQ